MSVEMKERFSRMYEQSVWKTQFSRTGSLSGTGSTPEYCAKYLQYITSILPDHRTVLDLGCGDWFLYSRFDWKNLKYTGVDIVESVIKNNKQSYPGYRWICADLLNYPINADLVLVKDVVQHWTDEEIDQWLKNLKLARFKTILVTNNWRHFRTPALNEAPRTIDNKYFWSPVDFKKYGWEDVLYYPKGRFKQVCRLQKNVTGAY